MITHESTENRQTRRRTGWLVAVVSLIAVAAVAVVVWIMTRDEGPVAASDAKIEMTFTGDATSYVGDHEIIEGTATVTLLYEGDRPAAFLAHRYEPGSDELANDPGGLEEGTFFVGGSHQVPGSAIELLARALEPGSHVWTLELRPGIWLLDVGYSHDEVWRAAVVEVVSE